MSKCLRPTAPIEAAESRFQIRFLLVCGFIISSLLVGLCSANNLQAATFARDAETELAVDPPGSPGASGIFGFTRFTQSPMEEDFDFGGSLKFDGKLYRLEQPPDQKSNASVGIEGDLEGEQLEVKTSGLTDSRKKEYDFSGTYRKLTDNELQRRAERRYDAADTWLNEIYRQKRPYSFETWNRPLSRSGSTEGRGASRNQV